MIIWAKEPVLDDEAAASASPGKCWRELCRAIVEFVRCSVC